MSVAFDESMIGYQPGKQAKEAASAQGKPIPTRFIPRKPHPNGLLLYQVC